MWLGFRFEQKIFGDGKQPVEELLSRILAWMEFWAQKKIQEDKELEIQRKENEEKARIAKELLDRKKKEVENFKSLIKASHRWHQTRILREYIEAYGTYLLKSKKHGVKEMKEWMNWANSKADWVDPFICKEDDLLGLYDEQDLS